MRKLFYILSLLTIFASCQEDEAWTDHELTPEQQSMIGSAVNFDISLADPFGTRVTYNDNGSFNQGDLMRIYRQYAKSNGDFDWQNEIFRTYQFKYQIAPGTEEFGQIVLKKEWKVYEGRKKGDYEPSGDLRALKEGTYINQVEADSLTWENGETVRFRAWSRSNLSNALINTSKEYYYPDFCASDWVTVSGPTSEIPLTLKHLGSRITFFYKNSGNRLQRVEVATDAVDYARDDNNSDLESDGTDKFPKNDMTAQQAADAVKAAFEKMCMPAGVDIETGQLRAMTKTAYQNTNDFTRIEDWEFSDTDKDKLVSFNTLTTEQIASTVQHPVFARNNDRYYIITIPYDMSKEYAGDPIVLPAWTRFKIWLYDVNKGDGGYENSADYKGEQTHPSMGESRYHIFSLSDIVDAQGNALYPDGLTMSPGFSYEFRVGYRYDKMTITPGDSFSWDVQDAETVEVPEYTEEETTPTAKYGWWKTAIHDAIVATTGSSNYNPEFHIQNEQQFLEFIDLVNGTAAEAAVAKGPIYHLVKEYREEIIDGSTVKVPIYGWSKTSDPKNPDWVEKSSLEAQGYIFYEHYYPSNANQEAYSEEDYLNSPYSFFDADLNRHFTIYLDNDLDFKDQKLTAVGLPTKTLGDKSYPAAFKGYFDGYYGATEEVARVHKICNLNVEGNYLFNYVSDASIRNLQIESTHTVGLLNIAAPTMNLDAVVGWGCYIAGISIKANNRVAGINAIAHDLTGPSYVVGCIHEGDAAGPLVGRASDLHMYGCMRTASNISGAALLGAYNTTAAGNKGSFFEPLIPFSEQRSTNTYSKKPQWGVFMCNYYNKDEHEDSKDAVAVGETPDDYSVLEYIRGRKSRILKAVYNSLLGRDVQFENVTDNQLKEFYGLAPWRAMNYAIYKYNRDDKGKDYPCMMHYEVNESGYDHLYPQLLSGSPLSIWPYNEDGVSELDGWNVLKQVN